MRLLTEPVCCSLDLMPTQFSGGENDSCKSENDAYDVSWSGVTPHLTTVQSFRLSTNNPNLACETLGWFT